MTQNITVGILFLVSIVCFIFFVKKLIETLIFLRVSQKTTATVTNYEHSESHGKKLYMPVFEFNTSGEKPIRFTSPIAADPPSYNIGDKVEVRYLRKNPQSAKVNSFLHIWLLPTGLMFVAFVCFFMALLMFSGE